MLRNILRTSRWLARKQINICPNVIIGQYTLITKCNKSYEHNIRQFSSNSSRTDNPEVIDEAVFEEMCNETLESLCDYFEELVEQAPNLKGADVIYSDGVLTVFLGPSYGTYVINRQTPNKQIWLSSPVSGPKRYDLILKDGGHWMYKHDGVTLHRLLQDEIQKIVEDRVKFESCAHSLV